MSVQPNELSIKQWPTLANNLSLDAIKLGNYEIVKKYKAELANVEEELLSLHGQGYTGERFNFEPLKKEAGELLKQKKEALSAAMKEAVTAKLLEYKYFLTIPIDKLISLETLIVPSEIYEYRRNIAMYKEELIRLMGTIHENFPELKESIKIVNKKFTEASALEAKLYKVDVTETLEVLRVPDVYLDSREKAGERGLKAQVKALCESDQYGEIGIYGVYNALFKVDANSALSAKSKALIYAYVDSLSSVIVDAQDNYLKCVENRKALSQLLQAFVNKLNPTDNELKEKINKANEVLEQRALDYRVEQIENLKATGDKISHVLIEEAIATAELIPPYKLSEKEALITTIKSAKSAQARNVTSRITEHDLGSKIKERAATKARKIQEISAESEANIKKDDRAAENVAVVEWLTKNLVNTENNRNPIFKLYHDKSFEGKDPIMAKIRENARKDDIAFLQTSIDRITRDKTLSGKEKLTLVQGALQYISVQMEKDRTFFTSGMDLFKTMAGDLQKEIQTFQSTLPKSVNPGSELRGKIDTSEAMEEFKTHVRLHSKDFGANHELTKKIISEPVPPNRNSASL